MVKAKPNCTGARFGMLTVLRQGEVKRYPCTRRGKQCECARRLWDLQCDCGNTLSLSRGDFDKPYGQRSCGCLGKNRKGQPNPKKAGDFRGRRFGLLTAIERIPGKFKHGHKPVWRCICDCGTEVERSTQELRQGYTKGTHCGDREKHGWGLWYPPTPSPYPPEAGAIVAKYLRRVNTQAERYDARIQDEIMDRLIRAAWILVYRRQQGEEISELHERRYINKSLRYCREQVRLRSALETRGGMCVTIDGKIKKIKQGGSEMTESNISETTVNWTLPGASMSTPQKTPRKIKFLRR